MKALTELVLASHNAGKLKELQAMLGDAVRVRSIGEFSDIEPEETGLSFVADTPFRAVSADTDEQNVIFSPTGGDENGSETKTGE